jgi:hypothetical protein
MNHPQTLTKRIGVAILTTKGVELTQNFHILSDRKVEKVCSSTTSRQQTLYVAQSRPHPDPQNLSQKHPRAPEYGDKVLSNSAPPPGRNV